MRPILFAVATAVLMSQPAQATLQYVYEASGLGTLSPGGSSYAYDVNDAGAVTGVSYPARQNSGPSGFIWTRQDGMRSLGTLDGGSFVAPSAINNHNEVVGFAGTSAGGERAFLWNESDGMMDLGTLPGDIGSVALGINDSGAVVGYSLDASNRAHAFIWTKSDGMIPLGDLGGNYSVAFDINASGVAVGWGYIDATGNPDGFIWDKNTGIADIGRPIGKVNALLQGINDNGVVVGTALESRATNGRAVTWDATHGWIDLGLVEGATESYGGDINNAGDVVGTSCGGFDVCRPFARLNSSNKLIFVDGASGYRVESANSINSAGRIAATGIAADGHREALVLTFLGVQDRPIIPQPIPEPKTWTLLLTGFGALGVAVRRRKFAAT